MSYNKLIFHLIILIIAILLSFQASSEGNVLTIDKVITNCGYSERCKQYAEKWKKLVGNYHDKSDLKEMIKAIVLESSVSTFSYQVVKDNDHTVLEVNFKIRPIISKMSIDSNIDIDESYVVKLIPLKEGIPFEEAKLQASEEVFENYLKEKGYQGNSIKVERQIDPKQDELKIVFLIKVGVPYLIKKVEIVSGNDQVKKMFYHRFKSFLNATYDTQKIKSLVEDLRKELFEQGYYNSIVEILNPQLEKKTYEASLRIKILLGPKDMISFMGNNIFTHQELMEIVHEYLKSNRNKVSIDLIVKEIINHYEEEGLYNTKITVSTQDQKALVEEVINHYVLTVKEGEKVKLAEIDFVGNSSISKKDLELLFFEKANTLISLGFYEKKYIENFSSDLLKREYLKKGFVFIKTLNPELEFNAKKNKVWVKFPIHEGVQCFVSKINVNGVDKKTRKEILKLIENKDGLPFNSLGLIEDFKKILSRLQGKGYYFSSIDNKTPSDVVQYSENYKKVMVSFNIKLGQKLSLKSVIITGNLKTKPVVIQREIDLHEGDVITPVRIRRIYSNLNSLGIFSHIKIEVIPFKKTPQQANILVQVTEKNSGLVELAPGYRSDIGLKMSLSVTHSNFTGMNRTLGFKGQVNQRVDNKGIDKRRKAANKKQMEFSGRINFQEPYLFNFPLGMQTSVDGSRKRFYSFDASIVRTDVTISKSFTKNFSSSMKYQLESIAQKNATDVNDNGHFRIGGLTPAMTLDLRDNRVTPTKGSYFNVSWEFDNPIFFSQKKEDHEINFYKIISRNKLYFPFQSGVFALSLSMGFQQNMVENITGRRGAIPKIKVFRLNGMDIVRGFRESEINRLPSGQDINDVDILDRAYFINLKLEPRYYVGDDTMVAPFIDAGGIYVQHFLPLKIRPSIGLSFKYLTPVGSLDFDYGLKMKRHRLQDGNLERPGEFHISIGFF